MRMGKPLKEKYASQLFTSDVSEEELTPTSLATIRMNQADKIPNHFDERHIKDRDIYHKLSEEERLEIEKEIAESGLNSLSRCLPSDFNDPDPGVRHKKAVMVNLYFEYGGNWNKVFKDSRSCSRRAMVVYWRDELFRAYIAALDPILMLEARGVVVEVWKDGLDEKARLAAALRYLEQADAYNWDRGVRKQVVANKGSLQSALFNRVISDEEFIGTYIKDKLSKIPDNAREALASLLSSQPEQQALPANPPQNIQVADMSKLRDPFDELDDDED